ncbi:MAG TPA: VOC family protein [Blastocatellia bacterium]|nr:VOC family protein [Blastocatellia bacterium]HMX24210.1 VOC family protein [Blastocatellia bacterium]HMY71831.1 VOC family protein [Blastocatellia bacterium]HMZ16591.1 VOC family protein [Blastocatellia bacterium]HNG28216.1 VOC family protein [Blastocatellia bacterium]
MKSQFLLAWYEVSDLDKAKAFYGGALGMETEFEMPGWAEFAPVKGGPSIGLALREGAPAQTGGAVVVLRVEDIHATKAELMKQGVEFDGEIEEYPGVVRLALFRDPFGNRLQLAQQLMEQ